MRPVRGVPGQLTQVFVNLFTNAAHAMRHKAAALASARPNAGQNVRVTITDDGHGIDAADLSRIFEPFFTTKTEGSGTGLGLSIVRNIILLHGGSIAVDSTPNVGTGVRARAPHRALVSE